MPPPPFDEGLAPQLTAADRLRLRLQDDEDYISWVDPVGPSPAIIPIILGPFQPFPDPIGGGRRSLDLGPQINAGFGPHQVGFTEILPMLGIDPFAAMQAVNDHFANLPKTGPVNKGQGSNRPTDSGSNPCKLNQQVPSQLSLTNHRPNPGDLSLWKSVAGGTDTRFWVAKDATGGRPPRITDPGYQNFMDAYNAWAAGAEGLNELKNLLDSGGADAFFEKLKDAQRLIETGASLADALAKISEEFPLLASFLEVVALNQGLKAMTAEGIIKTMEEDLGSPDLIYKFFEDLWRVQYANMLRAFNAYVKETGQYYGVKPCALDNALVAQALRDKSSYLEDLKNLLGSSDTVNHILDNAFGDILTRFDTNAGTGY